MRFWLARFLLLAFVLPSVACTLANDPNRLEIEITNKSPHDVCFVQISPQSAEDWGEDQLREDEVIVPNASRTFVLEPGVYDVMVRDCDVVPIESVAGIVEDVTITVGGPSMAPLRLDNASDVEICYVYLSHPEDNEWGKDWLSEAESILPAASRIFYVPAGVYDLLAQDCKGRDVALELGADLTAGTWVWTLSDPQLK